MAVGTHAKVLHGLAGILGATEQQSVGTSGSTKSELIESQDFTTSLLNAGASGGSEAESSDRQLGDGQKAVVVGNGSNNNNGLSLLGLVHVGDDARQRNRRAVNAGHEKAAQNNLVEVGIGTA